MLRKIRSFPAVGLSIIVVITSIAWSNAALAGRRIEYGQTVEATVENPSGDRWIFDGEAGDIIRISMNAVGDFDTYLELYGPYDSFLTEDDDSGPSFNSLIENFQLPDTGEYTILARGYGRQIGSYSLTLELEQIGAPGPTQEPGDDSAVGGELNFGELVSGNISDPEGVEWTFEGDSGEVITIVLNGLFGLDTYLELYDDSGQLLYSDDDSGIGLNARIYGYRLGESGTYHVIASGFGGETGEYEIILDRGVTLGSVYERGELYLDEGVTGQVYDDFGDVWTFEGSEGDVVTIIMEGIDQFDTYLELYLPSGDEFMQDDDGGSGFDAMIRAVRLPESGKYFIVARGYVGDFGEYVLTIELGSGLNRRTEKGSIEIGESQTDWTDSDWGDLWTFEGEEGMLITINLEGHNDFDTFLELYGPREQLLAEDDDSGMDFNAMLRGFELPETGTYFIVARGFQQDVGEYTLSLMEGAGFGLEVERGEISLDEVVNGEVTSAFGDLWTYAGTSGESISISLEGIDGFDTLLELYGPDQELLIMDDDSGADFSAYIDGFTLPTTGEYFIIARGYNSTTGEYRLSVINALDGGHQPPDVSTPTDNIATFSEVACGAENTYFIMSFPRYTGTQRLFLDDNGDIYWPLISITSFTGDADVRGIFPIASSSSGILSDLNATLRVGLFEMDESLIRTIESGSISDELSEMFIEASVEFEQVEVARIAPISSEQADLLVWVTHPQGSIVSVTMQWVLADEGGAPEMSDIQSPFRFIEILPCASQ